MLIQDFELTTYKNSTHTVLMNSSYQDRGYRVIGVTRLKKNKNTHRKIFKKEEAHFLLPGVATASHSHDLFGIYFGDGILPVVDCRYASKEIYR